MASPSWNLTTDDLAEFERAVSALVAAIRANTAEAQNLCASAFSQLEAGSLSSDEESRRARRIAERLRSVRSAARPLSAAARDAGPEIRSGVLATLPPELQAEVYKAATHGPETREESEQESSDEEPDEDAEHPMVAQPEAAGEWQTVLLLGDADEIQANERFLEQRGYKTIRVVDEPALASLTTESFAAVVIHEGFWASMPRGRSITDVLRSQFERASIAYFRIDSEGLGGDLGAVDALLAEYGPDLQSRLVLAAGSQLGEADVLAVDRFSRLLESSRSSRITVEDLSETEGRLLCASVALFAARVRSRNPPSSAGDLRVASLSGGRSSAKVFRVLCREGDGGVFVAKFDDVSKLLSELKVARRVVPSSQALEMEIYSLGGSAVLIQRLVQAIDHPERGAPSFRERIEARNAWERGRSIPEPSTAELGTAVTRLLRTVSELAGQDGSGVESNCWLGCEPLDRLAEEGLVWRIDSSVGEFDPRVLMGPAKELLDRYGSSSLVHGDLHAGNVLMSDDRTPLLIDFANAGAGHPMFDFVRFASAIVYSALPPVEPQDELRRLFERALVEGLPLEQLQAEFPRILGSDGAKLAISTLCKTRQEALAVATQVNLNDGRQQFLAMMYLVGAQSLTRDEFQSVVVAAALGAIYPELVGLSAESCAGSAGADGSGL